jgi:ubiquinone/menaquinone biosynthesis C-methylase UbiE
MDKRISRKYFNDLAENWEKNNRNNDLSKLKDLAKRLDIPANGWILDVGTGTGVFLPYIKESLNGNGYLVSMDFALKMIEIAKSKYAGTDALFICADIETLRVGGELFDAVICYSTFPHFHNKPLALKNIYACLKPGGRLYICHTSSRQVINKIHSSIPDLRDHLIPDNVEMNDLLICSGFTNHEIESTEEYYLVTAKK